MVIDFFCIASGVLNTVGYILTERYMEAVMWACVAFYGLVNYLEHNLRGSKYDY